MKLLEHFEKQGNSKAVAWRRPGEKQINGVGKQKRKETDRGEIDRGKLLEDFEKQGNSKVAWWRPVGKQIVAKLLQ